MDASLIRLFLSQTEVLRAPRHALATFGATMIDYHMISPIEDMKNKTRLREGKVLSRKPQILTAQSFSERFEGFGEEGREFSQWLNSSYRDLLRALEYNFKNESLSTRVISESPQAVADRMKTEMDKADARDQAVISCPDSGWSLALMKFTLDESARSFPANVQDLERRGMFDSEGKQRDQRRREVEELFAQAKTSKDAANLLGAKLREHGLFDEYEDRYLGLF